MHFLKKFLMKSIRIGNFCLAISMFTYASDAPIVKVSYAAEKAEVEAPEISLPEKAFFTIPVRNREITHALNLADEDALTLMSFKEIIQENAQQGLPTLMSFVAFANEKKQVYYAPYEVNNILIRSLKPRENKFYDFVSQREIINTFVHLVSVNNETTPATIQTTFFGNLLNYNSQTKKLTPYITDKIHRLYEKMCELKTTNDDKEMKTIKIFTEAGNICVHEQTSKRTNSVYNAQLAVHFFQKVIHAIDRLPENILCNYDHDELKKNKINCLRRCGTFSVLLYNSPLTLRKDPHGNNALKYYMDAINMGDTFTEATALTFINSLHDLTFLHSEKVKSCLQVIKQRALIGPKSTAFHITLSDIDKKLGNIEQSYSWINNACLFNPIPTTLRKNQPKPQQEDSPDLQNEPDLKKRRLN